MEESSPPTRLGLGLVEVSALSTLIGSVTTELLTLGERGAAGLPWAAMSAFGSLSIVKACVAAVTPAWMRESLGVRNATADSALGMDLSLNRDLVSRDSACRTSLAEPVGVVCRRSEVASKIASRDGMASGAQVVEARDVYVFDRSIINPMTSIPTSTTGDRFCAHLLSNDPDFVDPVIRLDWLGLIASLLKIVEAIVLFILHAPLIAAISSSSWLYFFMCGTVLQLCGQSRGFATATEGSCVDIVAGRLPTPNTAGGERKIVLQALPNHRNGYLWKVTWIGGAAVATGCVIAMYIILSQQTPIVTYVWLGFQALWLILRSAYFHLLQGPNTARNPLLVGLGIVQMDFSRRKRTLDLANAVSTFQIHVHPRGSYAYDDDVATFGSLFNDFLDPLKAAKTEVDVDGLSDEKTIVFEGVIGDTLLSSLAWFYGSKLNGPDLYDSCIVIIKLANTVQAIPSARVLCAISRIQADIESGRVPKNVPKGSFNWGRGTVKWIYWIPCSDGRWLEACTEDLRILGKRELRIVTDADITHVLDTGEVNVSHKNVDDVRKVVEYSQAATQILREFLGG